MENMFLNFQNFLSVLLVFFFFLQAMYKDVQKETEDLIKLQKRLLEERKRQLCYLSICV